MSPALATSQTKVATRPFAPAEAMPLASSSTSGRRARMATSAPDAANSFAMARPSPLLAPVMIALLPSRRTSIGFLPNSGCVSVENGGGVGKPAQLCRTTRLFAGEPRHDWCETFDIGFEDGVAGNVPSIAVRNEIFGQLIDRPDK